MKELLYQKLPEGPGVYLMKNRAGEILYIGKAANLRRRVSSYFLKPHNERLTKLLSEIYRIDYVSTETAIEALILEADLIKKHKPAYNIKDKDDKSFLYIEITKESFPRVLLVRGKSESRGERFGPFTSASSVREALKILRRLFPFSIHPPLKIGKFKRPCFDYALGLCPGTCVLAITRKDYLKNIRELRLFLSGKKKQIIRSLEREMKAFSEQQEFEKAEVWRRRIFALRHIQDIALIGADEISGKAYTKPGYRIEAYDISNISGTFAVGGLVVFEAEHPNKKEYRRFKIRTIEQNNDIGMLQEVLRRRFNNHWPLPDLILVDGGKSQVNATNKVVEEFGLKIPVVGIAKGKKGRENKFIGSLPASVDRKTLIRARDEAHRFALNYHKKLRDGSIRLLKQQKTKSE